MEFPREVYFGYNDICQRSVNYLIERSIVCFQISSQLAISLKQNMASLFRNAALWRISHSSLVCLTQQIRNYKPRWVAPTLRELQRRKVKEIEKNGGFTQTHRSTYLEWNYDAEIFAFANRLGEMFDDKLLRQALTHKSYILKETQRLKAVGIESGVENLNSNDSLADEGNIFLQKSLRGYLRSVLRKAPEECIEAIVDHLTSDQQLAIVSKHIGITDLMLCEDFPPADQTLAKSLKAVVAALEKSSGEDRARNFIYDFVVTQLYGVDLQELWNPTNPMGVLADILQRDGRGEPEPRLLRKAGSNTILAVYQVGIYSDRELVGSGFGESVEIAQEMAARDSLRRLFSLEDNALALPLGRQAQNLKSQAAKAEGQPNISVSQWSSEKVKNVVNC